MLEWVKRDDDPRVLIVTPLLPGDEIDPRTLETISSSYDGLTVDWVSYTGKGNIPANTNAGIEAYRAEVGTLPEYIIKIDNDVIDPSRHVIRSMVSCLDAADARVAYAYTGVTYFDETNNWTKAAVAPREFSIDDMLVANYVTSNSLVRSHVLVEAGMFIDDDKYVRLLDWAFWLKLLRLGYVGSLACDSSIIALYTEGSVSAGTNADYIKKASRVRRDFVDGINFKEIACEHRR